MKIRILFRDFTNGERGLPTPIAIEVHEHFDVPFRYQCREMILDVPDEEIKKLFKVPVVTPTIIKKEKS